VSVPVERLFCEARRAYQALDQAAVEACAAHGLSATERALLDYLDRKPGPVDVADIARSALLPHGQLLDTLWRMQASGWVVVAVVRTGDAASRASARLDTSGRDLCTRLREHEDALWQRLQDACGGDAVQATFATLRHLRRVLRRTTPT
jgi:hypothetical protein